MKLARHYSRMPKKTKMLENQIPHDAACEYCGYVVGKKARETRVNLCQKDSLIVFCNKVCKTAWLRDQGV